MQEILSPLEASERGYISIGDAIKQGLTKKDRTTLFREAQPNGALPSCLVAKGARQVIWVLRSALDKDVSGKKSTAFNKLYTQWLWEMENGTLTGHRISDSHIHTLKYGFGLFWEYSGAEKSIASINAENFRTVMSKFIDDEAKMNDRYSAKMHVYKACTSFLKFLARDGFVDAHIIDSIRATKPKPKYKPKRDWLEEYEIDAVIKFNLGWLGTPRQKRGGGGRAVSAMETTDILLHLYSFAGLRREEALVLKVSDINFQERIIKATGKGNKQRFVTPLPRFWPKIESWVAAKGLTKNSHLVWNRLGKPLSIGAVNDRFDALRVAMALAGKRAEENRTPWFIDNVDLVHPHSFRRSFAIMWNALGMPLPDIQLCLGHESINTTMAYLPISIKNTQRWVNQNIYNKPVLAEEVAVGEDAVSEDDLLAQMIGI